MTEENTAQAPEASPPADAVARAAATTDAPPRRMHGDVPVPEEGEPDPMGLRAHYEHLDELRQEKRSRKLTLEEFIEEASQRAREEYASYSAYMDEMLANQAAAAPASDVDDVD